MRTILGLLRHWVTQDVARTNAAQASVRLQHRRRQLADVDAFLAAHHHQSQHNATGELSTHHTHPKLPRIGET
jgi:hypothetical protein